MNEPNREWTVRLDHIFEEVVIASSKENALEQAINITALKFKDGQSQQVDAALRNLSSFTITLGNRRELQRQIEKLKQKIVPGYRKSIDVDEGWYQLVVDCDKELTGVDPNYQIYRVKEKFGGLHYYVRPSNLDDKDIPKRIADIVAKYEDIASRTCSATGRQGVLMKSTGGWGKTLNPEYAAGTFHYEKYSIVKHGQIEQHDKDLKMHAFFKKMSDYVWAVNPEPNWPEDHTGK
jgi:hypothetical protein